jgi:uncharacterized membrane protein YeaQ/YmgE (transglycosylase-associated protein family)
VIQTVLAQSSGADTGDSRGFLMSVFAWLFVGVISGFIASKVINLVGIHSGGGIGLSIIIATLGAIVVLLIYHKLIRPRTGGAI